LTSLPPIPKRLAARIRAAQARVLDVRSRIEATEFNSLQDEARWNEFTRDPEAFARKYYPGHGVDSYPVQTNTSRIREKLDKLPARRERNQRDLGEANAQLTKVEAEVQGEVSQMRPTTGLVPWPSSMEPYETFHARAMAKAYYQRDTAEAQREAYLAKVQKDYDEEIAAIEIERQVELDELAEDMKSWTPTQRAKFRELMSAIAEGLRTRTLTPDRIGEFINEKLKR